MTDKRIGFVGCSDPEIMSLAVSGAKILVEEDSVRTAMVLLTSACKEDGHGTHVTVAVLNRTGKLEATEARAACRRLRSLADQLEALYAPEGSEN